jgi:hypothetical protein
LSIKIWDTEDESQSDVARANVAQVANEEVDQERVEVDQGANQNIVVQLGEDQGARVLMVA